MSEFTRQEWEDARSDYVNKKMSSDVYASMCFMYINSLEKIINKQGKNMENGYCKLELQCESMEADTKRNALSGKISMIARLFNVEFEDIMENLNFEDVMNYYGVSAVLEWAEANR